MQNELPKIDIPVDCVAGTDITKEFLSSTYKCNFLGADNKQ